MKSLVVFIALVFATKQNKEGDEQIFQQNAYAPILVKIEEDEYVKKATSSRYIGVTYHKDTERWRAYRHSRNRNRKIVHNGSYKDEERAARASDTLARKFMANGKQNHKLNFPDDKTEVYPEKAFTSKYMGVSYNKSQERWQAQRRSKKDKMMIHNGTYKDEETAAHASDTLARQLIANGEQNHKLNFPDDGTEVYPEKKTTSSKYIGVFYHKYNSKWRVSRGSKNEKKMVYNGYYKHEETAAHASDNLAKTLMANGEKDHKLNFPDDKPEVCPEKNLRNNKRKRPDALVVYQKNGNFDKFE